MNSATDYNMPATQLATVPTVREVVTIANPQGLHLRPAAAFAKLARQFPHAVNVVRDGKAVNGKSQIDLLLLAAEAGTELTIEVTGQNAEPALRKLADLLAQSSCDDDD